MFLAVCPFSFFIGACTMLNVRLLFYRTWTKHDRGRKALRAVLITLFFVGLVFMLDAPEMGVRPASDLCS